MKVMKNPKIQNLSKSQLIELVSIIESNLMNSIPNSYQAAKEYSDDPQSQLAYEVGHLNGYIKTALSLIEDYKKC
jgi:hypothetical protein